MRGEREEKKKEEKEKEGPSSPYARMHTHGEKRSGRERSSARKGNESTEEFGEGRRR